jgi:hypothetical protein
MKYSVEIGTCAMIYTPSCITTGSVIQKLLGEKHKHMETKMIS